MRYAAKILFDILIEFSAWFALASGLLGISLFAVMLASLGFLKKLGKIFNKTFSVRKIELAVNKNFEWNMKKLFFTHSKISGSALCLISFFLALFLAFRIDMEKFLEVLKVKVEHRMVWLIGMQSFQAIVVSALFLVFFYGLILFFCTDFAKKLSNHFNRCYDIEEKLKVKLEKTITKDIDTISFLRNKPIGLTGLILSIILVALALYDLFFIL
ncbi:MAG: hypothetical protein JW928_02220 [Candidatus Aureabacteria bacterium]|nr:hypothetical protein [Candidatus Auribacterota bacterium]